MQEAISNISRSWLSAKRRYWIHASLHLGLAFESWAAEQPLSTVGHCAYVKLNQSTVELYSAPCSEEYYVICMKEDLALCNGEHVYEYMCYFIPDGSDSSKSFADSKMACEEESGHLVHILNQHQMQWISDTFRSPFWTGYEYNESSTDLFWYDGNPVTNVISMNRGENRTDCVFINGEGNWQMEDCQKRHPFICILEIPYATKNTDCRKYDEECVCYWHGVGAKGFHKAMEHCLSEGGTLAYPNSDEKLADLRNMISDSTFWVGISDGNTEGVYRASDASVVRWMQWRYSYGPSSTNQGYDCIKWMISGMDSYDCETTEEFVCQSLPDSYLHECTQESGCLRSLDYWELDYTERSYTGHPDLTITNVKSLDRCWDLCVNYIGFVCLVIRYNTTTKECFLIRDVSGNWRNDSFLQSRMRTRRVLDPDSYCLLETGLKLNLDDANEECGKKTGWKIPVVMDETMINKISKDTWISAKDSESLPRVFKTLEGDFIPFAKWAANQPSNSYLRCVYVSSQKMYISDCGRRRNAMCFAKLVEVCTNSPNITNGYKVVNITSKDVLYTCEEGYFMPTLNVTYLDIKCNCDWESSLLDVTNCTVLNCTNSPIRENTRFSLSSNRLGSIAQVACNDWYWMPELNNDTVNTTCVMDKSRLFAYWCWVPHCREIICSEPPAITMGTRVVEGNKTVYTCQPNYRIHGTSTNTTEIYCRYDENFNTSWPSVPSCEAITCSGVPEMQRASNLSEAETSQIGATITYQCSDGFSVYQDGQQLGNSNQFNVTCQIDYESLTGKWTGSYSCEVPQCENPPELPNSNLTISGYTVGSIANYTCDTNYITNSTKNKWTISSCVKGDVGHLPYWTTAENCSAICCGEPGNINNAVVANFSTKIGDLAKYSCKSGYKVRDIEPARKYFNVVCELTNSTLSATWSEASGCEEVKCLEPPRVLNSEVVVSGYNIGDSAVYTCYPEFISNVGQTWESRCLPVDNDGLNAAWEPIEECIDLKTTTLQPKTTYNVTLIRQCPVPITDIGFTAQTNNLFIQSDVSYFAKAGYFFPNGGTVRSSICSLGGHWTYNAPDVRRFRCPLLPSIFDATKSTDENDVGTEVKIQCKKSAARLENGLSSVNIRCTYNKEWTFIPKSCDSQRCGPFEVIEYSHLIAFNNTIGGLATIECNLSYRFADGARTKSFRCVANLTWEPSERCYLNVCPHLPLPANAQISTNIALEGTTVQVKCLPGFMFPDRRRIQIVTCNSSFLWSDLPDDCEVIRCPDPPEIVNGNRTSSATFYNSSITYTCDETYRLQYGDEQMTIRCKENAEWTYSNLSCGNDRCPPVPSVENASPSTFLAVNGTTVIYTCYKGYIFPSNYTTLSVKCNGMTWNITAQACMKVTCPKLNPSHARVLGNGSTFGDVVKLICDEGYIYDNNITGILECKANSQWSGDTRGCKPIDCGSPPDVKYSIRNVPASHHFGTTISFECVANYWFKKGITKKSVLCTRYGKWSEIPGDCTPIICPPIPVWNDMEANTTVNVVGTVVSVRCTSDEANHSIISLCNSFGEWQPALDNCKTDKVSIFEPEPEEATGAGSIGIAVIGVMVLLSVVLGISDAPLLLEAVKGRMMKRRSQSILHSRR